MSTITTLVDSKLRIGTFNEKLSRRHLDKLVPEMNSFWKKINNTTLDVKSDLQCH